MLLYQRKYSWGASLTIDLFKDLLSTFTILPLSSCFLFLLPYNNMRLLLSHYFILNTCCVLDSFKDQSEYFLANIVLAKGTGSSSATPAKVIDGQQRLTTLLILFSAGRSLRDETLKETIRNMLIQKKDAVVFKNEQPRLETCGQHQPYFLMKVLSPSSSFFSLRAWPVAPFGGRWGTSGARQTPAVCALCLSIKSSVVKVW